MAAVEVTTEDRVMLITLNRPEARNAVNGDVAEGMEAAIDRLEADEDLWIGIVTGNGPVFCAGADLKEISAGSGNRLGTKRGGFAGIATRERNKPLIAAVNGAAVAGGCEIVLACDMAVMSQDAVIGIPEVKRSLVAAAGGVHRLPRVLGKARAMELALTGDPIGANEALAAGLVNGVVPADRVLDEARALAARVTVNAPLAAQAARRVVEKAFDLDESELFEMAGAATIELSTTEDFAEGPRAFIEKRPPVWKGR